MRSTFTSLLIILLFVGCAKTSEEEIRSAIREARYHLTSMDCSKAKEVLDDVGQDKDNADYVAVYASSIACEAGYTDLGTAFDNLTTVQATSGGLLSSFAAFPSSNETSADATTYTKVLEAAQYILEADGGAQPNTTARLAKYGTKDGNDLSMQAFLMVTVAMGKFFNYYGNASASGLKGGGAAGNVCIGYYPFDAQVNADLVATPLHGCNSASAGHADLNPGVVAAATVKRRLCEGIVLFNNMFDILSGIDLSGNSNLGDIPDVAGVVSALYTSAATVEGTIVSGTWGEDAILTLKDVTSQSECEDNHTDDDIQRYYVLLFETNFAD